MAYFFIGQSRDPVQRRLQLAPLGFQFLRRRVTRHPDGVAPAIEAPAERVRDQEMIPAREEFFFEQLKANGTIGCPVALAS